MNILLRSCIVFCCVLFSVGQVRASHAFGGDIAYEHIGPNTYRVMFTLYRDCGGIAAAPSITLSYSSQTCGQSGGTVTLMPDTTCITPYGATTGDELPLSCGPSICMGGTIPGVQVYTYCGVLTLPMQCSDWIISYSECCRNNSITNIPNASSYDLYTYATINNLNGLSNNSIFFTQYPLALLCMNNQVVIEQGAVDLEGDSIAYSLINPLFGATNAITTYTPGLSPTHPAVTNGAFNFDSTTGHIDFVPVGTQSVVITLLAREYRNGQLIGTVLRDMQYNIINCSNDIPQVVSPLNVTGGTLTAPNTIEVCQSQTMSFSFYAADPDGDSVIVMSNQSFPGASITYSGTDTIRTTVTWIPGPADVGQHNIVFQIRDNACPVGGQNSFMVNVIVRNGIYAGTDKVLCASNPYVQLQANNASAYTWSPSTGLSDPNIANPIASPTVTTTYILTGNVINGCGASDTITVTVNGNNTNANAGVDEFICSGAAATLQGSGSGLFRWSPSAGLSNVTIANPIASPAQSTTYYLTVTDTTGCTGRDSVQVQVSNIEINALVRDQSCGGLAGSISISPSGGIAPYNVLWNTGDTTLTIDSLPVALYGVSVTDSIGCTTSSNYRVSAYAAIAAASASSSTACDGDSVQLSAGNFGGGGISGLATAPCIGATQTTIIGTDTTFIASTSNYPAIFGHFYEGGKHQILYRASELQSMGFSAGTIDNLAFSIARINGTTQYCNFIIKLGTTPDSVLQGWQQNLTTVYSQTINTTLGWNDFDIADYTWNGTSNLVLEVCFSNDPCLNTYTLNSQNHYTATPYNSVLYYRQDNNPTICLGAGAPTTSTNRPNTRFNFCNSVNTTSLTASWSPSTGLSDSTAFAPMASPDTTTDYVVTITDWSGCASSDTVRVNVVSIDVQLGNDTVLCTSNSLQLHPQVSGTSPVYYYNWSSDNATFSDTSIANPIAYLTSDATVILTADAFGCYDSDTMLITLDTACYTTISGTVYHDLNGNCIAEPGDTGLAYVLVSADNQYYTFTDPAGNYSFSLSPGQYSISHQPLIYTVPVCPPSGSHIVNVTSGSYPGNDFHDQTAPNAYDLSVSIFSTMANTLLGHTVKMDYHNNGTLPASPQVILTYDADAVYSGSTPIGGVHNAAARQVTWSLPLLQPGQTRSVYANFNVSNSIGDILIDSVQVLPVTGDWTPADNYAAVTDTVVGSYDPNDKHVSPQGAGPLGFITVEDSTLSYLINFQNVGTAPAQDVVIRDTLDSNVDINTFRAGNASHSYTISVEDNNKLIFTFANINLPDSTADMAGSKGFISYRVRQNPGLALGTQIFNSAGIYFDNNSPVITNTVVNTIYERQDTTVDTTGIDIIDAGNIRIYPNPAQNVVYVALSGLQTSSIELTDQLGRVVATVKPEQDKAVISTAALPSGIYFIKTYTAKGIISRKVSVVH